jgi:hypothetical protein
MTRQSEDPALDVLIRQALQAIEEWSPAPDAWSRLAARLAEGHRSPQRTSRPRPARRTSPPAQAGGYLAIAQRQPPAEDTPGG